MFSDLDAVGVADADNSIGSHDLGQTSDFSFLILVVLDQDLVVIRHHRNIRRRSYMRQRLSFILQCLGD